MNWLIGLMLVSFLVLAGCDQNPKDEIEYDFIYEVVNKSGKKLTISNFIFDENLYDENKSDSYSQACVFKTQDFVLAPNETHQFKYNIYTLIGKYGQDKVSIGCNFQVEGLPLSHGWKNGLSYGKGKKHTVTITLENGIMNGENSWGPLNSTNKFVVDKYEYLYSDEYLAKLSDEAKAELQKNKDGKYIFYCYNTSDTPEQYSKYFNTHVCYLIGTDDFSDVYKSECKVQIEQLLNNGNFEIIPVNNNIYLVLNYNPQLLTKAPDKNIRVVYVAERTGGIDALIIYDDNTWTEYVTNNYYGDVYYSDGTYEIKTGDETNGTFDIVIKNFRKDFTSDLLQVNQPATISVVDGEFDFQEGHYVMQ